MPSHAAPLPPSLAALLQISVYPTPLSPYQLGLVLSPTLPDEPDYIKTPFASRIIYAV